MSKIPVGETISRAYSFTFSNFGSIVGVVWFPLIVLAAIFVGLVLLLAPDVPAALRSGKVDMSTVYELSRATRGVGLAGIVVSAMIAVGIQCKALGLHPEPVYFFFSLGAPVWRMVGALFLAGIVIGLIAVLLVIANVAIWFGAGQFLPSFAWAVRAAAIAASILWFIYMCVRLVYFLPAVVVAENRIGLDRAWQLGAGNFWRIFIVSLAVFLPASIAFSMIWGAFFGALVPFPGLSHGTDLHDFLNHLVEHAEEYARLYIQTMLRFAPFVIVFSVIERIVYAGLANGAIASAYLAVVSKPGGVAAAADPPA